MPISIAIYGSHDSSICINPSPGVYRIYELERITKIRNFSLMSVDNEEFTDIVQNLHERIRLEYEITNYGSCFHAQISPAQLDILRNIFGFEHFEQLTHHGAHAAGAIYQSDYEQALVISSDSGGHEVPDGTVSTFCIFLVDKTQPQKKVVKKIADIPLDVCGAYTLLAIPITEIQKKDAFTDYLKYAGKIMGLAAYGRVRTEWLDDIRRFYYGQINLETLKELGNRIGFDFSNINTIEKQNAYDIAATSQFIFEELTLNAIMPYIEKYRLPVILTGGAGLNVLLNERIRKMLLPENMEKISIPVFVPVNPNDCGLSFGMLALQEPPATKVKITYNGFGILDSAELPNYVSKYNAAKIGTKALARMIHAGKIVGVMRGNSECGARALGNRSILCNPAIADMKEVLNSKVKFREFYRPFAPMVKAQDANKYFIFEGESEFMSYAPEVRIEYKTKMPSVVHADGTARLQTVTEEQNDFIYELLCRMEAINGIGVLLNTSFNVRGYPILTTIADALEVLNTTGLDAVYIEGYLFEKKK